MKWPARAFTVPEELEKRIECVLQEDFSLQLSRSKEIAESVLQLSDFFIQNPGKQTPWSERWCRIAYLAYYTPLNCVRALAVMQEARRLQFFSDGGRILDFGSGLGSGSWATHAETPVTEWEPDAQARSLAARLRADSFPVEQLKNAPGPGDFSNWMFSYSLVESGLPKEAAKASRLVIMEPSTRAQGRDLMRLRSDMIARGYHAWAPCTHQEDCPLLIHSEKDWCHDRIHFTQPAWFSAIEKHLPVKNATLTFSYLLLADTPPPATSPAARTVGDLLREKGKNRQLICQNNERVFLTWLHRDWKKRELPEIPRGELIATPSGDIKGNELRTIELSSPLEQNPRRS